jgi:hypothetical protein
MANPHSMNGLASSVQYNTISWNKAAPAHLYALMSGLFHPLNKTHISTGQERSTGLDSMAVGVLLYLGFPLQSPKPQWG